MSKLITTDDSLLANAHKITNSNTQKHIKVKMKVSTTNQTMKAVALPDKTSCKVVEIPKPIPQNGEVVVKIKYAALDTAFHECAQRTMIPGSLLHNLKVNPLVIGWHFSGTIESVADGVTDLKKKDKVFGHLQYSGSTRQGSLAEYITVPIDECAKVPIGIAMDMAAAVTTESLTALQGLRDQGGLCKGKSVLIIAAAGGVGSQAVQIVKALKAGTIHGVCSTKDVDTVKELGADLVINRNQKDVVKDLRSLSYDVIFDTTGKYSYSKLKYALKKNGKMVSTIPNITTMLPFNRSKAVMVQCNKADLDIIGDWLKSGDISSIKIDSTYSIKDIQEAWERQDGGKRSGRVVIKVEGGW